MNNPIAVIISDVHYNIQTLEVADKAVRLAIAKANELKVPLIVAGDLHDTKANIRGECIKSMLLTFEMCHTTPIILRGNHDSINEKSAEHSLEFLCSDCTIIKYPVTNLLPHWTFIPYQHDANELRSYLKTLPKKSNIIMHQGITGSRSGDYIQDKSAIQPEDVASFNVISGHYHTRQYIPLPEGGVWNYVGNPYTLSFNEAVDPEKGFQILYDTGVLEFVPTNLRKHVIISVRAEGDANEPWNMRLFYVEPKHTEQDIIRFTISGPKEWLYKLDKTQIAKDHDITQDFRLDLIPIETTVTLPQENVEKLAQPDLLDSMIDSLSSTDETKKNRLKSLWKELK